MKKEISEERIFFKNTSMTKKNFSEIKLLSLPSLKNISCTSFDLSVCLSIYPLNSSPTPDVSGDQSIDLSVYRVNF